MLKRPGLIVLTAVIVSLFVDAIFGRVLAVKLSVLPLLNRYKLISPEAPIVITNQQTVRVSDSGDVQQALTSVRPKLSLLLGVTAGQVTVLGGALNLTSDGLFIAVKSSVGSQKAQALAVKLDDGTLVPVTAVIPDIATDLVILKTGVQNVPTVNLASSRDATLGQKVIFAIPDQPAYSALFQASFISQTQSDNFDQKNADSPSRGFKPQDSQNLAPGEAVIDTDGNVLAVFDSGKFISSDVIKDLSDNYFSAPGQIMRPQFGFSYRTVGSAEAQLLSEASGVKVMSVTVGGPAQKAGLLANDAIQSWNQTSIADANSLEEVLGRTKPGDTAAISIIRGKTQLNLTLTAGQLK